MMRQADDDRVELGLGHFAEQTLLSVAGLLDVEHGTL